ncbi:MAG: hypothetical protein H7A44_03370 [Opitutaceae bacterium]|nr:hypothetical protein [Opitutaceae bacterium]
MRTNDMISILSGSVLVGFGFFLLTLAAACLVRPELAKRFLSSFASSAAAHYGEMCGRLVVGVAIIIGSPAMWLPNVLQAFGWIIVVTTVGLLLIPWRWHHAYSKWAIPLVLHRLRLFGVVSGLLAVFILYNVSRAFV